MERPKSNGESVVQSSLMGLIIEMQLAEGVQWMVKAIKTNVPQPAETLDGKITPLFKD